MPRKNLDEPDDVLEDDEDDGEQDVVEAPVDTPPPVATRTTRVSGANVNGHAPAAGLGAVPVEQTPPAAAPRPRGRPPGSRTNGGAPAGVGASPAQPETPKVRETKADLIWQEFIDKFSQMGVHPSVITIHVTRTQPHPEMQLGSFGGDAVPGGAEDFFAYIVNYFHSKSQVRGPATYTCRFNWKGSTQFNRQGTLTLPAMEELGAMGPPKAYGAQGTMGASPYQPPPPPYPQPSPYAPAPYPPNYQGFGYAPIPPPGPQMGWDARTGQWVQPPAQPNAQRPQPPPPNPPQGQPSPQTAQPSYQQQQPYQDPQVAELRAQVGYFSGKLDAVLDALAKGQSPQSAIAAAAATPPPAPAQPAPAVTLGGAPVSVDAIADAVLRKLGVTPVTAAQAAAPIVPAQPPAQVASAGLEQLQSLVNTFKTLKGIVRDFDETLSPEVEDGAPLVEPPKPEEKLPFGVVAIPDVQILGHPANYAKNLQTGEIDWKGMVLANPGIVEKGMEILGKIAEGAAALGKAGFGMGDKKPEGLGAPPQQDPFAALDFGDSAPNGQAASPPVGNGANGAAQGGWPDT